MTSTMAVSHEEPILSKLDRLDNMLRQLEEIKGCSIRSSSSPYASTPSSGTLNSDGHVSSIDDFSPKSLEKHCRPIDNVVHETELKGTLIDRLTRVEDRVIKLCLKMEEELIAEEKNKEKIAQKKSKKGFAQLVKQCVKGETLN